MSGSRCPGRLVTPQPYVFSLGVVLCKKASLSLLSSLQWKFAIVQTIQPFQYLSEGDQVLSYWYNY